MNRALTILLSLLAIPHAFANWPHWRGPSYNGSSTTTGLPDQWSKTENVAWTTDLPGPSAATPVIHGDRVFISSTDTELRSLVALGIDKAAGKVVWKHTVAPGIGRDNRSNFASPSPVTDGERVIFFYGNGPMVAFDLNGKKLWEVQIAREFGEFAFLWTFSSSPLLYNGKLYLQVLQRNEPVNGRGPTGSPIPSYLLALDPASGKTLWKVARPSEAVSESLEAFTSPVPFEHQGRKEILVIGGDDLTGHDPATGKELWRWGTWNPERIGHWRLVPSPVAGQGLILACAPKSDPIYAIKAGGNGKLTDDAIAWKSERNSPVSADVPTPAFYSEDFFILGDVKRALLRVEPRTGNIKWKSDLPGRSKYESSPLVADNKVYVMNFKGEVTVVDAGNGSIVRTVPMGEDQDDLIRSSIVASGSQIFIRTNTKLFCVGAQPSAP